jgi:hypothetical protein
MVQSRSISTFFGTKHYIILVGRSKTNQTSLSKFEGSVIWTLSNIKCCHVYPISLSGDGVVVL